MRHRLVTLAGALLALFVFYALFFSEEERPQPTRPASTETGVNGLYALSTWLESEGVKTLSLRDRFSMLESHPDIPSQGGNVLVISLPWYRPAREVEIQSLKAWLEGGNTILALAALNDTSDWSVFSQSAFLDELHDVSGAWFSPVFDEREDEEQDEGDTMLNLFEDLDGEAVRYTVAPRGEHPLMRGVSRLEAESDLPSSAWEPDYLDGELMLSLATLDLTGTGAVWQRRHGYGQVIIVGSGTMFTNRAVARADNRRFIANVVALHLADDGRFIFDDMHQGLSSLYDPDAFFADSRLHTTLWFVIAFWLLYIVGSSNRLLSPEPDSIPLRQTDFVEAFGAFISNHSKKGDTGLWLFRSWFNDVRRHLHLPLNGEPVWNELDGLRTLDPRLLAKLKRQHDKLSDGAKLDPLDVYNTIHHARKAIG